MSKLNKKFYKILNDLNNTSISTKDIPHEDIVALVECGFLKQDNCHIISSKGILALDEYRSNKCERLKSYIILLTSIIGCAVSIFSCFKK